MRIIFLVGFLFGNLIFSAEPSKNFLLENYIEGIIKFQSALTDFLKITPSLKQKFDYDLLRGEFKKLRSSYKDIEYLVEYFNSHRALTLNGPLLLKTDPNDGSYEQIIKPSGLQLLEEYIYQQNIENNLKEYQGALSYIILQTEKLQNEVRRMEIKKLYFFEAINYQILRVLTLGISGFDASYSNNSILESAQSLKSILNILTSNKWSKEERHWFDSAELQLRLENVIEELEKNPGFENFDRASFLRENGSELYSSAIEIYRQVKATSSDISLLTKGPVNFASTSIFNKDFLDKAFYSQFKSNKSLDSRIKLGRTLFFEPLLSGNNQRSCASCHNPKLAFSDGNPGSLKFDHEGMLDRNSPGLIGAIYQNSFFWDMRSSNIETQMDHVFQNEVELNTSFLEIENKLKQSDSYISLFKDAFPKDFEKGIINRKTINMALSEYIRSLTTHNSDFEKFMRGELPSLKNGAENGFNIFMGKGKCSTCHFLPHFNGTVPPRFTETESEILGVPKRDSTGSLVLDPDMGRFVFQRAKIFKRSFKTPGLKNVALTAPYMHNGVFKTLREVVEFYNVGGGAGLGFDVFNQTLPPDSLHLTQQEISDLVAFMETLTDTVGTQTLPEDLPEFPKNNYWNLRMVGGTY